MISVSDITKVYRTRDGNKRRVLDNVSFELHRGQAIGIVGRNGSGKSTLVRILGGIEQPTSGSIERHMSVSWPLGFVGGFQVSLTGADNIRFIARIYGMPHQALLEFVEDFAELGEYIRMPVKTYSSGMRARLMFGISLALEFDCYLIDEGIAVGDARFREKTERALAERLGSGSMVLVSHEPDQLRTYCTMGGVLHDGRLTCYASIDEAMEAYRATYQ
jgi:ABC-type polysaccharide/polyol phosphate transport system ATPase subunit